MRKGAKPENTRSPQPDSKVIVTPEENRQITESNLALTLIVWDATIGTVKAIPKTGAHTVQPFADDADGFLFSGVLG
jgi:hypothetical protein